MPQSKHINTSTRIMRNKNGGHMNKPKRKKGTAWSTKAKCTATERGSEDSNDTEGDETPEKKIKGRETRQDKTRDTIRHYYTSHHITSHHRTRKREQRREKKGRPRRRLGAYNAMAARCVLKHYVHSRGWLFGVCSRHVYCVTRGTWRRGYLVEAVQAERGGVTVRQRAI